MATVAVGVLASHTTLMNTRWADVEHLEHAVAFRDALGDARAAIERSGADVAVIIGPNHFRGFWLDLMPSLTIGVGDVIGAGEHGTPAGPLPSAPVLARHIVQTLMDAGFDPAFSTRLHVDHGITHAVQYIVPPGTPIVPVVINSFAPPLPAPARCHAVGAAIATAVRTFGGGARVAVIASGGLSHTLPFPDWRTPVSDDDEFLVDSWTHGRDDWRRFEDRRRSIVVNAPPVIEQDFDHGVLTAFERGDVASVVARGADIARIGGNGANEIRNWIAAAAACGGAPSRTLCYSPVEQWLTGMAVAVIDAPRTDAPPTTNEDVQ
jgi:2,3-dihydroxyphenylpropionate 1,2-dioxygenase